MTTELAASEPTADVLQPDRLRVLLVDPAELIQWGFRLALHQEPWVERLLTAGDAEAACELAARYEPNVAVIGLPVPGVSGLELCAEVDEASPDTRILLLADDAKSAVSAREWRTDGIIPKTWPVREIVAAARSVAMGMTVKAPDLEQKPIQLTRRELRVLEMVAIGSTNREIATQLNLSHHTVKDHVSAIFRKVGARNRAEAIQRGQRLGLLA